MIFKFLNWSVSGFSAPHFDILQESEILCVVFNLARKLLDILSLDHLLGDTGSCSTIHYAPHKPIGYSSTYERHCNLSPLGHL